MIQKGENAAVNKAKMLLSPKKPGQAQSVKPGEVILQQESSGSGKEDPWKTQPQIPGDPLFLCPSPPSPHLPFHQGPQQEIEVWFQQVMFYNRGFLPTILLFTSSFSAGAASVLPSAMPLWPLK